MGRWRSRTAAGSLLVAATLRFALGCSGDGHGGAAESHETEVRTTPPRVAHVPPWALSAHDLGALEAREPLTHLRLMFARSAAQQEDWDALLAAQGTLGSAEYHRWLTPEEIGARFGASDASVSAARAWLLAHRLHVDALARSRGWLTFSGAAGDIGAALSTDLHRFDAGDGVVRIAPTREPTLSPDIAGIVRLVTGLSTAAPRTQSHVTDITWTTGAHYIGPGDFATIYDVAPVYAAGIKGAGQTIAIVGRARVAPTDISEFQMKTGLPVVAPTIVIPPAGTDPGLPANDDQLEATLDVTRAGSVAPGATISLVVSAVGTGAMMDGTDIAEEYVIDNKTASILSISFGQCEQIQGAAYTTFDDNLFQMGAMAGISIFVSSGDSGVAGCDAHGSSPPSTQVVSANYLCASGSVTCVGGTEFADTASPSTYWGPGAGWGSTALGTPPEGAWNEPLNASNGTVILATGGGVSIYGARPVWQAGTGVPPGTFRVTPDVAFSAAGHDGYAMCYAAGGGDCSSGGIEHVYGTSAAAPSMAGIAALVNEKAGSPQGNLNPVIYSLAAGASASAIFHDVTVTTSAVATCTSTPSMCNNSTPGPAGLDGGLAGYIVGPGYDLATGWGSLDVANFLTTFGCVGAADGSPCNDANACTEGETCQGGTCSGGTAVVCVAGPCTTAGVCAPATGCSKPPVANGTTCAGTNLCMTDYACANGACVGSKPVTCTAIDECHFAGVCDPTTGVCSNPNVEDNVPCQDTNLCTPTDTCQSGICVASDPILCPVPRACELAGACVPATGQCSYPRMAAGTPCDGGTCSDGGCVALVADAGAPEGDSGNGGKDDASRPTDGDAGAVAAGAAGGCSCRVEKHDDRRPGVSLGTSSLVLLALARRRRPSSNGRRRWSAARRRAWRGAMP